jgi:hypothetical protein
MDINDFNISSTPIVGPTAGTLILSERANVGSWDGQLKDEEYAGPLREYLAIIHRNGAKFLALGGEDTSAMWFYAKKSSAPFVGMILRSSDPEICLDRIAALDWNAFKFDSELLWESESERCQLFDWCESGAEVLDGTMSSSFEIPTGSYKISTYDYEDQIADCLLVLHVFERAVAS